MYFLIYRGIQPFGVCNIKKNDYNKIVGEIMQTQTIDETMARAKQHEKMTKATRFTNVFGDVEIEYVPKQESLMRYKIDQYTKEGYRSYDNAEEQASDIDNIIVEDPNEAILNIEYKPSSLPFFKSISAKLNKSLVNIK